MPLVTKKKKYNMPLCSCVLFATHPGCAIPPKDRIALFTSSQGIVDKKKVLMGSIWIFIF